ncbi:MAG TPA: DUF4190 domain-containing protein [Sedimentisphaerales bacterium]|nr:DUF4190 domain-containing protein [Sedimentisphaerales bacterium]
MSHCTQSNGKGMAIASLVLGILSLNFCCCNNIFGILAVVFGLCARSSMKQTGNYDGSGLAIAGVVLGSLGLMTSLIGMMIQVFMPFFVPLLMPFLMLLVDLLTSGGPFR